VRTLSELVSVSGVAGPVTSLGALPAVVSRELVPSSHGHGHADAATGASPVGFALFVVVDARVVR